MKDRVLFGRTYTVVGICSNSSLLQLSVLCLLKKTLILGKGIRQILCNFGDCLSVCILKYMYIR